MSEYKDNIKVNLNAKVAVITGGNGYLCSEMAYTLARNGAKVIIIGRSLEKNKDALERISALGAEVYSIACDATDKDAIKEARKEINSKWGSCDILINGAGGNSPHVTCNEEFCTEKSVEDKDIKSMFDIDISDVEDNMRLNFTSALLCTQVFGQDMLAKKAGNIINISSMATYSSITRVMSYSASKAALDNLTQWLAVYFSRVGIRVNAIAPGFFIGTQNRRLLLEEDGSYTSRGQKIISNTPMQRFGTADELSSTLLYLVSEESKFVTGVIIPVDGGFTSFSGV